MIYRVLSLDGGGIMGLIFLKFLAEIEAQKNKKIPDMFDAFIGTSTGAISAAMLAAGYSACEVLNFYLEHGKYIFDKVFLWPFRGTMYDRSRVDRLVLEKLPMAMRDLHRLFICTSVNMLDDCNTHFFKSDSEKEKGRFVCEFVQRSISAPVYLGYKKDAEGLWADGGVGVHNCTAEYAAIEILRRGIKDHYLLSLGCGEAPLKASGVNIFNQIKDFIPIARRQATRVQINNINEIKDKLGLNFDRVDIPIKAEHDKLDGIEYIADYLRYGDNMYLDYGLQVLKQL